MLISEQFYLKATRHPIRCRGQDRF